MLWHPSFLSVTEMARRIDTLESSIEELLQGQSSAAHNSSES